MRGTMDLDGITLKAEDRVQSGLPPWFAEEIQYAHELRDGALVCVPLRPRTRTPVSFRGLFS